jgi:hypothetical protein
LAHLRHHLRSGDWLTPARIRAYCWILLALVSAAMGVWAATADGLLDRNGKPLGTDFAAVYAAGTLLLNGAGASAYDPAALHAAERALAGGRAVDFTGWHYPPLFFAVAGTLARLPYGWALLLYQAATLAAFLAVIRGIVPAPRRLRDVLLVAAAFPAVWINVGHGQNGLLTAALLGGALLCLPQRPFLAGVLVALLAYKPQFAILVPLALLAGGHWRTLLAASVTLAIAVLVSVIADGAALWQAFFASTDFTRQVVLEQGATGWEKIQSVFAAARMFGAGLPLAYALQGIVAALVATAIAWLWRSEAAGALKASALASASLLATPYVLDYDFVVLGLAIAFCVRHGLAHGFRPYEKSVLALGFAAPLAARGIAAATGVPLGLIAVTLLLAIVLRRAIDDGARVGVPRLATT